MITDSAKISIGNNVLFGPGVQLYTPQHPLDMESRHRQGLEYARPITICDNVWIGGNAILLGGICVGEGSVVGAGSVVTKDVPPFTLVVGNPARALRRLS